MSGTAEIIIMDLPVANAGYDHNIVQGSFTQLQGSATYGSGNYNYQWTPSNLCVTPSSASTQTSTLYISTIYTFEVSDNESGCTSLPDTSIVYVNSGPLNVQVFTNDNNICFGESANLIALASGGTGNYSYLWTSSPPGFTSTSSNTTVTPNESTVYTIVISDGIETVTNTLSINVFELPQEYNINSGGSYCQNNDGVEILLSGSEIGIRYSLYYQQSPIDNMFGDGQQLSFGNYTQQGSYNIRAVNENTGCVSNQIGEAIISVNELPIAEAGANFLINSGDFATLAGSASGGSGGYVYSWTPSALLINSSSPSPSTVPLDQTTMFNLTVSDVSGCQSAEDNAIVFVTGGQVTVDVLSSGSPVCPDSEVQLYAMASGGSGSFSYFWQSNPMGFTSTAYNPTVFPTVTTTYIVSVNDGLEVITDSITILVNPTPIAYSIYGGGEVCQGDDPSNIFLTGSETGVDYQLLQDGAATGMTLSGTGFGLDFGNWNTNGIYTAYAINLSSSCDATMAGNAVVTINQLPISMAGPDQMITGGTVTTLAGSASGGSSAYQFQWEPSYLCVSPTSQNTVTQPISQTTLFSFVVSDAQTQCSSLPDTMFVFTQGDELYASASATPLTLCAGEELSLAAMAGGGTGNYSYTWTSMPDGYYSSQAFSLTYPVVSTTYFLDVFDGLSHAYDTIYIEVLPTPIMFNILGGGSICDGNSGLSIGLDGSEMGVSYSLFRSPNELINTMNGTGQPLDFGTFTQSGSYYSLSNSNGYCQQSMIGESVIIVNQNPIADAGEDQAIQFNTQAILSGSSSLGSGDYNYLWSPSDSLLNPNIQQPQTTPLHSTLMYNLVVTDDVTGCISDEDNTIVFVTGGPFTLQVTSDVTSICLGESTQLLSFPSGGTGNYSYSWTSTPSGFISTSCCPTVSPLVTTVYNLTVTDGNITLTDNVSVVVNPLPIAFVLSGGGEVCYGNNPNNIILNGSETGIDYLLLQDGMNTGMNINGTGFALDFGNWNSNGTYTVYAENLTSLCSNNMVGNADVSVNQLPIAYAGSDVLIPIGATTTLSGTADGGSGTYQSQWEPSYLCVSPTSQNTVTQPISQTTLFSYVVTDIQTQCTSLPDTMFVFTHGDDLYASVTASPSVLCAGEELLLAGVGNGGSGNYSYTWTSLPAGFHSSQPFVMTYPTENTTYYLDVFDGISHAYDSIFVVVESAPLLFNITGGGSYCVGGNGVSIGLSGSEIGANYSLFRNPQELISEYGGTGQLLDFGNFTQSGTYFLVSDIGGNCHQTMAGESIIIVNQNPVAEAGEDQAIQFNTQAVLDGSALSGSGDYNYLWSPSDSLINANIQQPQTVALHTTLMYNLVVTDNETGCASEEDNTIVFVTGGPFTLQVTSDLSSVCPGSEIQLFSFPSGGSGNYSYSWTSNPAGFSSTSCCPTVSPTVSTTYNVTVSDGNIFLTDFVTITVNPLPLAYALSGGGEVCFGQQSDDIVLQNSELNTSYSLLKNGVATGISKSGTGFPLNFGAMSDMGQYSVFAIENTTQCYNNMAGEVSVLINALPIVDAGQDVIIPINSTTSLEGQAFGGLGGYAYYWQPASLCQSPQLPITETSQLSQTTLFTLGASDIQTQCSSLDDSVFVFVSGDELYVNASASAVNICNSQLITLLALPGGGTGSYSFSWTSNSAGFNSSQISPQAQPSQSTTYYIEVFDGINFTYDSVYVNVLQYPEIQTVTGGGDYCMGDVGVDIGLVGSEQGTPYRLFHFPDLALADVIGTGNEILFGTYMDQGDYFVVANADNICQEQMNGIATVVANQIPEANAGDDKIISWSNQVMLNGSAIGGSGVYNYSWLPADSLVNPTYKEPTTVSLHASTMFNLSVVDANTGCFGTDDNALVFISGGNLSLSISASNETICANKQIQLFAIPSGGSGNYTYLWSSNPMGMSSNIYNPTANPNITTTYIVTVNDGSNTVTDSIIINVSPSPSVYNIIGGGMYCVGNEGVNIQLDNSDEDVNYELFNSSGSTGVIVPGSGDTITFGNQSQEDYYWAIATANSNGCISFMEDTVQVTIAEVPIAYAGFDQYIEQGESAQFNGDAAGGSGYYNYNWFPDYLFVNPNIQDPTTNPLNESTLFKLVVDDANYGCLSNADTVIAYVINTGLSISVSASPLILCEGTEVSLSVLPNGGSGNYSYLWSSNPLGFYSNNQFPVDYPNESTTYIVEVNDGDTIVFDSIFVEVIPSPEEYILMGGGSYCINGNGVNISLSGSQPAVEYTLFRNGNIEVISLVEDGMPIDFGEYNVNGNYFAVAGNYETGCLTQMAGLVVVNQYPQPIANAGEDITISMGANATLNGSALGGTGTYSYMWTPTEKLLNPNDPDATTVALVTTTLFSLQVIDQVGCESDKSNMIVFMSGGPLSAEIVISNNQICPGEEVSIIALAGGGNGNYSYFWESLPSGFNATSSQVTVSPIEATWYKVSVSDGDNIVSDSVLINLKSIPTSYELLGGGGYCSGNDGVDIYLKNSSLSTMYSLYHNTILTGQYVFGTGSQISFGNMMTEGNYSVIAQNDYGCTALMQNVVQVYLNPKPEKFQLYGGGTYCQNDATLGILLESSEVDVGYELYKDAISTSVIEHGTGLPLSFSGFTTTGNYSIVATADETGCTNSMLGVASLIINDIPQISISGENSSCLGDSIVLSGSGAYSYEWNTTPPLHEPEITVAPIQTTSYALIGYNIDGCSDTATHNVEVSDKPEISLINDLISQSLICYPDNLFNYEFYLGDILIQGGDLNTWYYGGMGLVSDTITVIASTSTGCSDEDDIFVELKDPPNAFTPNGDGKNDLFLEGFDIIVFSSWGGEIYNGNTGWDGMYNGTLVVPGTYYYIHHILNTNGAILKTIKGSVTVVIE